MYRTFAILVMSASCVGCASKSPPTATAPHPSLAERLFGGPRQQPVADDDSPRTARVEQRDKDTDF